VTIGRSRTIQRDQVRGDAHENREMIGQRHKRGACRSSYPCTCCEGVQGEQSYSFTHC